MSRVILLIGLGLGKQKAPETLGLFALYRFQFNTDHISRWMYSSIIQSSDNRFSYLHEEIRNVERMSYRLGLEKFVRLKDELRTILNDDQLFDRSRIDRHIFDDAVSRTSVLIKNVYGSEDLLDSDTPFFLQFWNVVNSLDLYEYNNRVERVLAFIVNNILVDLDFKLEMHDRKGNILEDKLKEAEGKAAILEAQLEEFKKGFGIYKKKAEDNFELYKATKIELELEKQKTQPPENSKPAEPADDHTIQKIYAEDQRAIIAAIESTGFKAAEFQRKEKPLSLTLVYPGTPYLFRVNRRKENPHSFKVEHTVFNHQNSVISLGSKWYPIGRVTEAVVSFINNQLKPYLQERDAPNPWEEFEKAFKNAAFGDPGTGHPDHSTYTKEEKESIDTALTEIKLMVEVIQADQATNKIMYDQLKYLTEGIEWLKIEAKRQSRSAFKTMWMGFWVDRVFGVFNLDAIIGGEVKQKIFDIVTKYCGYLLK